MFCGLGEKEKSVQDLRRKKRKKKERKEKKEKKTEKSGKKRKKQGKNLIAAKSGLVGMKGYHKSDIRVKYFLPYLTKF